MRDTRDDGGPESPSLPPARPAGARPRPAREQGAGRKRPAGEGGEKGHGRSREGGRRGRRSRKGEDGKVGGGRPPPPARALTQTENGPLEPVPPDVDGAQLAMAGDVWHIRVLGRSGGVGPTAVPMLLLGFWPEGEAEGEAVREALIVGRTLEALTTLDLENALAASREPRGPSQRPTREERRPRRRGDGASGGRGA
jgi:hypothetical protein